MAVIDTGSSTAGKANVTTTYDLQVRTPTTEENAGFAQLSTECDSGAVLVNRYCIAPEATEDFRLRVGTDHTLFNLAFEGTNTPRDRIMQNDTTMTCAQSGGYFRLNSGLSVTTGQATNIRTYRSFPLFGSYPLYVEFWVRSNNNTATGAISEFGVGYCSTTTQQMTDGVIFRLLSGGAMRGLLISSATGSGVDIAQVDITTTNIPSRDGAGSFDISEFNHYIVECGADTCKFWCNDTLLGTLKVPSGYTLPCLAMNQPLMARVNNIAGASAARSLDIGFVNVSLGDMNSGKPYGHMMCGMGGSAYNIQPATSSGPTVTRGAGTAGWPTSATARAAGTWTATSAPGIGSLGGLYTSPAISTLTSDADYPIFAYLNPAGSATSPGKTLYITGVRVGESIATAAASTNSIVLSHIIGVNSVNSVTTGTDSAASAGIRGIPVGAHAFGATDAVGTMKNGYQVDFSSAPLVSYPGSYVHFIIRPFGTVTSNTLVVTGSVTFIGYFE
jgi:hypothetical protein